MKVKKGTGVLSKDNKTPFAAGTAQCKNNKDWNMPVLGSWQTMAAFLTDKTLVELNIIENDNTQWTFTKEKGEFIELSPEEKAAIRAEMFKGIK